jgi:hypothetical protein
LSVNNCLNCEYLSKRPGGSGGYFIFKCSYWGLVSQNILPQTVVFSSIGKKCPFYKKKELKNNKKINDEKESNSGDLDITV